MSKVHNNIVQNIDKFLLSNQTGKFTHQKLLKGFEIWSVQLFFYCHKLNIHLENGQHIYFTEGNAGNVVRCASMCISSLLKLFELCQKDAFAKMLPYLQSLQYYTFNQSTKKFCGQKKENVCHTSLGYLKCIFQGIKIIQRITFYRCYSVWEPEYFLVYSC